MSFTFTEQPHPTPCDGEQCWAGDERGRPAWAGESDEQPAERRYGPLGDDQLDELTAAAAELEAAWAAVPLQSTSMNDPRQVRLDDAIQAMDDLITPEVMLSVVAEIRRLRSLLNPPCAEANCKRKPQVQAGSQWLCNDHFMARLHASLVGGPDAAAT